jgi:hypothetical protein
MRPAVIRTVLVLSVMLSVHLGAAEVSNAQGPCLPPGISPEFLSWPFHRVIAKTDAEVIPGDTIMYRDTLTGAKVLIVKVDGIIMVVDPTPDAELIDLWVRVTAAPCQWQRSRERAA